MKNIRFILLVLLVILTSAVTTTSVADIPASQSKTTNPQVKPALAPEKPIENSARLWNLQDADILSIINEVSLETGKNFIVDPRVTGKISLVSSKPIKPQDVYQVFLSALELLGYSAIPTGNIVKIVPNMESTELASRIATNSKPGTGDEVVVRVIPLQNVSANQLVPVLRPLLPQWSNITVYTPGNVLLLVGHANNLQRIMDIIANVDRASNTNVDVVPLRQASAAQVANTLSNLESSARMNGENSAVSIVADERTNSILLSGNKASRMKMRLLITQLDNPVSAASGNTEVIYLRYLEAKTFAPVLGKIADNIIKNGNPDEVKANPTAYISNIQSAITAGKKVAPENHTTIQAEPSTNALIITAPPTIMKALQSIIAKLDISPAQVLVEAIIVEIDQDDLNALGIQWGSVQPSGDLSGAGVTPAVSFPALGAGTYGIIPNVQFRAVLTALENKTGVNILSTPSIVVLDNQKATLKVGKQVPSESGSYATSAAQTTVNPFNTIETKDVVLQLDVTPQINLGSSVRLSIKLKNDSLQNPDNPTLTPLINTSEIDNSVIIHSDDVLVIGGLTTNSITEDVSKTPILGDIPILGLLFQNKSHKLEKKTLMAFIKPVILHTAQDAGVITNTKYNTVRDAQINWPQNTMTIGEQKTENILPPWNNPVVLPKPFADN